MSSQEHLSVLLNEAVAALNIRGDGVYLDGTFGRGGHSRQILGKLGGEGRLLAADKDPEAIAAANTSPFRDRRFEIMHSSFVDLYQGCLDRGLMGKVDGILLDLGVSSPQLDNGGRGFSMMRDGPLDMRMNPESGLSAAEWINRADSKEITEVLKGYGEERYAKRIAGAIVRERENSGDIETTARLAEIIKAAHPRWEKGKHPATKSFQGIRIWINRELDDLDLFLERATDMLAMGGRLVVISFHSLEDRRVKRFMRQQSQGEGFHPDMPLTEDQIKRSMRLIDRAVYPQPAEIEENPRARSAVMRVAERIG